MPQEGALVDVISHLQQLLDNSKFVEAQKEAELYLLQSDFSIRTQLLEIYFNSLTFQSKQIPAEMLIEYVENISTKNPDEALGLLHQLSDGSLAKLKRRVLIQRIIIAESKGLNQELYRSISELQIHAYARKIPSVPQIVSDLSDKYFPGDFSLSLQRISLFMLRGDIPSVEKMISDLIFSCIERSTPKGTREKLLAIVEVLTSFKSQTQLEIYRNLCLFLAGGIQNKQDYKRVVEMVIFAEDFRLQTLVMALIQKTCPEQITMEYAKVVKGNENYTFVYFDKYFPQLKKYFVSVKNKVEPPSKAIEIKTESLSIGPAQTQAQERFFIRSEEETMISHLLKHQSFEDTELLDLAVGFLQSEFPWAAVTASEMVLKSSTSDITWLKASYLKLTGLLMLNDSRAALDLALESLGKSKTQNDILSFMYCQAEAQLRLKDFKSARKTLKRIVAIDENYRLAKEKLEMLDAI